MERFRWSVGLVVAALVLGGAALALSLDRSARAYGGGYGPYGGRYGGVYGGEAWMFHAQFLSDFWIALAYFSIPLELLYFMSKSQVFPFRWILLLFSAFIVLCGITHAMSMWTVGESSLHVHVAATVVKVLCALVSCVTALVLLHVIPDLLALKIREMFLKHKAEELDREVGLMKCQEETGRMVRMLTNQICMSQDSNAVLKSTLAELGRTLNLSNCCLFAPSRDGSHMELLHSLLLSRSLPPSPIPSHDPSVRRVIANPNAQVISSSSELAAAMALLSGRPCERGALAAVRVPLLHMGGETLSRRGESLSSEETKFAILTLALPNRVNRSWHVNELSLVEVVADQVAIAVSHAAMRELWQSTERKVEERDRALERAGREASRLRETHHSFLKMITEEVSPPVHRISSFLETLQNSEHPQESSNHSAIADVISSSASLSLLLNDVIDYSSLEHGSASLDLQTFFLHDLFSAARKTLNPLILERLIAVDIRIDPTVPIAGLGDRRKLLQVTSYLMEFACRSSPRGGRVVVGVSRVRQNGGSGREEGPLEGGCLRFEGGKWFEYEHPNGSVLGPPSFYLRVVFWSSDDGGGEWRAISTGEGGEREGEGEGEGVGEGGGGREARKEERSSSLGLKLALCRGFCRLHGGDVSIESQPNGKDKILTAVTHLGIAAQPSLATWSPLRALPFQFPETELRRRLHGTRILVIDEDLNGRIATGNMLESLGCQVEVAASGPEGLALLAVPCHGIQLVLLELSLKAMDGLEVALRIYGAHVGKSRPLVVAFTANTEQLTRGRCQFLCINGVIAKPVAKDELGKALCGFLGL